MWRKELAGIDKSDNAKVSGLYQKACDKSEVGGCSLGVMYADGQGVKQSNELELKYFGMACDLKSQDGCDNYAKFKARAR